MYALEDSYGPEHAKIFSVRVDLPDGRQFRASGPGLKRAEQEAAHVALVALGEEDGEEKYGKYVYEVSGRKKEGAYFKLR